MRYSEEEIRVADAALLYMKERRESYVDSMELFSRMGHDNLVRNIMIEDLGLMAWHSSMLRLTDRGRMAAEKGFRKYIENLDREAAEISIDRRLSIANGLYSLLGGGLVAVLAWLLSQCSH